MQDLNPIPPCSCFYSLTNWGNAGFEPHTAQQHNVRQVATQLATHRATTSTRLTTQTATRFATKAKSNTTCQTSNTPCQKTSNSINQKEQQQLSIVKNPPIHRPAEPVGGTKIHQFNNPAQKEAAKVHCTRRVESPTIFLL
jgi:hypothetical protein